MIAWLQRLVSLGLRNGPRVSEFSTGVEFIYRKWRGPLTAAKAGRWKICEMKNLNALRTKRTLNAATF